MFMVRAIAIRSLGPEPTANPSFETANTQAAAAGAPERVSGPCTALIGLCGDTIFCRRL